ncbi:MAG: efflux RND transporter periplasmic adaptor subunit [Opitutales bacterium]|nr:efflux RND transporter periplasmic adaptor subunit [Opitutales bacterium]
MITSFKFWRWIILVVVLAVAGFSFFWMSVPEAFVSRAERDTAQDIVLGTVEVREYHLLQLRSERSGTVTDCSIEIGDKIKKGQVLMKLDTQERQIDLERLLIDKQNFEDNLKITRQSEYTLQKTLEDKEDLERDVERGVRPQRDLELFLRNLKQLRENIERQDLNEKLAIAQKENAIKRLHLDIEKMTIRSPVDGTVTNVYKREGDLVSQSSIVFDIIDSRRLVVAEISEEDYDKVEVGLSALVRFLAYPNDVFQATVTQVLPTANPITQRYEIYLSVDTDNDNLTPGLTGEVSIIVDEREGSVLIPSQALIGNNVLRIEGSRIKYVKVVPGFKDLLRVEILEGIREGDIVVTEELTRYRDGELVRYTFE